MTSGKWTQIKDIVSQALELEPTERQHFIDSASISRETRREVESLLAQDERSRGFMSVPAGGFSHDILSDGKYEGAAGQTIGSFEIIRELGIGGMGAVYLAERRDGKFDQRVAIKLLKREFNVGRLRRLFDREVDIQSRLNHPNIARILDTGLTDDGIPFIVMEYVDGVEVDRFCRDQRLGLRARLKLFNKICGAVSFAHRNLIVHRDLKASNILITSAGEPKLLDFGISKLLEGDDQGLETVTMTNALTPAYASPEQVRGERLTTATDVYSLAVVLSKMLTGRYPIDAEAKTNGNLAGFASESRPAPPSVLVSGDDPLITRASLEGDIDNIVLKALSHEPERRYESVEQLSADIWRFIDGRPVEARPASRSYRLSKFYMRNRIAVVAAILVLASLVAGIAVSAWQTRIARANAVAAAEARNAAVAESDNAKAEQKRSEKISRFMMRFISYANPRWHAEGFRFGGEARVIDALNDMASKIDTEFADQPDVLAELHHQFCDTYAARKEPDSFQKAREHALRAYALRRSYYGDWHELVAKDMAFVYWMSDKQPTDESVQMMSDAIVMMRATNPKNLNLPFMLEAFVYRLIDEEYVARAELHLRHAPQPAPNDRYLAADQYFDEMLSLLRLHFEEESAQVINQKCGGMVLKLKVNKLSEAQEFYKVCVQSGREMALGGVGKRSREQISEYRRLAGIDY